MSIEREEMPCLWCDNPTPNDVLCDSCLEIHPKKRKDNQMTTASTRASYDATLEKQISDWRKDLRKVDEGIVELLELRIAKAKKLLAFKADQNLDEPVAEIHDATILKLKKLERRHVDDDLIEATWRLMFAAALEGFHGTLDAASRR